MSQSCLPKYTKILLTPTSTDLAELAKAESGLGIMRDDQVKDIREKGKALKNEDRDRPIRKQDIVEG